MTKTERAENAVKMKHSGFNCSQAVTVAFADLVSGKVTPETLRTIAAGFGGGMGCMEATCGSLIGANMIAGLLTDGTGTVMAARNLLSDFRKKSGAVTCKDLKGRDTGKVLCVRNAVLSLSEVLGV